MHLAIPHLPDNVVGDGGEPLGLLRLQRTDVPEGAVQGGEPNIKEKSLILKYICVYLKSIKCISENTDAICTIWT